LSNPNSDALFDLIILDLNMPICGGREACQTISALFNESIMFHDKAFVNLSAEQVSKNKVFLQEIKIDLSANEKFVVPI